MGVSRASGLPSLSTLRLLHFAKSEMKLGADVWDPPSVCRLLPATMGAGGGVRRKFHPRPPRPSCLGLLWSGPCPSGWGLQGSRHMAEADMALDPQKRVQGPLLQNSRGFVETSPTSTEPGLGTRSPQPQSPQSLEAGPPHPPGKGGPPTTYRAPRGTCPDPHGVLPGACTGGLA